METVGFICMGKMGIRMAVNIQKAGYSMAVYDALEGATRPLLEVVHDSPGLRRESRSLAM